MDDLDLMAHGPAFLDRARQGPHHAVDLRLPGVRDQHDALGAVFALLMGFRGLGQRFDCVGHGILRCVGRPGRRVGRGTVLRV